MIVIPMAGASRRFTEAGYTVPKYKLMAGGQTLFAHCVASFSAYFETEPFLFVVRAEADAAAFVRHECERLGVRDWQVSVLSAPTRGQAETVCLGLDRADVDDASAVTIFNIDTIRKDFRFPQDREILDASGFLEVFSGSGDNWSFVKPGGTKPQQVIETAEKVAISNLCCTGLYHFSRAGDLRLAFSRAAAEGLPKLGEFYVAPLYNAMIATGHDIRFTRISRDDVTFSGTPDEYRDFCDRLNGERPV